MKSFWQRKNIVSLAFIDLEMAFDRVDSDEYRDRWPIAEGGGSFQLPRLTGEGGRNN